MTYKKTFITSKFRTLKEQLDVLKNDSNWKKRIIIMNKIKNYYKKKNYEGPNFNNLEIEEMDKMLNQLNNSILNKDC